LEEIIGIISYGGITIELRVVSVQELNGSYFAYIPKIWIKDAGIQKGDKIAWIIEEGNHQILQLKKLEENNVARAE
jgi:hypothetical protein